MRATFGQKNQPPNPRNEFNHKYRFAFLAVEVYDELTDLNVMLPAAEASSESSTVNVNEKHHSSDSVSVLRSTHEARESTGRKEDPTRNAQLLTLASPLPNNDWYDDVPNYPVNACHSMPSQRRTVGNTLIGVTTALLAAWFAWCGIAAWKNDSALSSFKALAPSQISYQTENIEDLRAGDTVIAMNPETGEVDSKQVVQVFERVADHLQLLTLRSSTGERQLIETTDEHPFWLALQREWKRAADLKAGDTVTGPNNEIQTVISNEREEYPEGITVYNFEVEDWHSYFVIANGVRAPPVLVHNANPQSYGGKGNEQLKQLMDDVKSMNVSAGEKTKILIEQAAQIEGITFTPVEGVRGAHSVFKGAPLPTGPKAGQTPVVAVLENGQVVRGYDVPHPFGKPYRVIDLNALK